MFNSWTRLFRKAKKSRIEITEMPSSTKSVLTQRKICLLNARPGELLVHDSTGNRVEWRKVVEDGATYYVHESGNKV